MHINGLGKVGKVLRSDAAAYPLFVACGVSVTMGTVFTARNMIMNPDIRVGGQKHNRHAGDLEKGVRFQENSIVKKATKSYLPESVAACENSTADPSFRFGA